MEKKEEKVFLEKNKFKPIHKQINKHTPVENKKNKRKKQSNQEEREREDTVNANKKEENNCASWLGRRDRDQIDCLTKENECVMIYLNEAKKKKKENNSIMFEQGRCIGIRKQRWMRWWWQTGTSWSIAIVCCCCHKSKLKFAFTCLLFENETISI